MTRDHAPLDASIRRWLRSPALPPEISRGSGAALAFLELAAPAFVAAGVARAMSGDSAPWFVAAAVIVGFALRAVDLESCARFVPGGLYGSVKQAFGPPAAVVGA